MRSPDSTATVWRSFDFIEDLRTLLRIQALTQDHSNSANMFFCKHPNCSIDEVNKMG
jgi:hypothetical protein